MNNRIKELSIKAREEVASVRNTSGQREMTWFPEAFEQRFADLIVRECMNVVSKRYASATAYNALVKHFGVEE